MEAVKEALLIGFAGMAFCIAVSILLYIDGEMMGLSKTANSHSQRNTGLAYEAFEKTNRFSKVYSSEAVLAYLMTDRLEADVCIEKYAGMNNLFISKEDYNLMVFSYMNLKLAGKYTVTPVFASDGKVLQINFCPVQ